MSAPGLEVDAWVSRVAARVGVLVCPSAYEPCSVVKVLLVCRRISVPRSLVRPSWVQPHNGVVHACQARKSLRNRDGFLHPTARMACNLLSVDPGLLLLL